MGRVVYPTVSSHITLFVTHHSLLTMIYFAMIDDVRAISGTRTSKSLFSALAQRNYQELQSKFEPSITNLFFVLITVALHRIFFKIGGVTILEK